MSADKAFRRGSRSAVRFARGVSSGSRNVLIRTTVRDGSNDFHAADFVLRAYG